MTISAALFPRFTRTRLAASLGFMRVVSLVGPRQAGKSTLATSLGPPDQYIYKSLDNPATLALALDDPNTFLEHDAKTLIIDEIQRAPSLILPIKVIVDRDQRPGRVLLTGSADVFAMRQTQDSLAGRVANFELLPLSQCEIIGIRPSFIKDVFEGLIPRPAPTNASIETIVATGGFPSAQTPISKRDRREWMDTYIQNMVARDVRTVSNVHELDTFAPLVQQLALRAGGELNYSALSRTLNLSSKTIDEHISILEKLFLVQRIQPYFGSEIKRLVKSSKLFFVDSGILAHECRFDAATPPADRMSFGPLLKNFVFSELLKQIGWAEDRPRIHHLRTSEGLEIDFILEAWDRRIVALEVKAGATIKYDWVKPMKAVRDALGRDFIQGIILYTGKEVMKLGDRITAVPISTLWGSSA